MLALLDHRAPMEAEVHLIQYGHRVLRLPSHPDLPSPVSAHVDLLLFFAPNEILCTRDYFEIAKEELSIIAEASKKPLRVLDKELGNEYPSDVLFNAASVGAALFCYPKAAAGEILACYESNKIIAVKQGYTKCNLLPVDERSLITEDPSIASAARNRGFSVMQIPPGHVELPGYDTGFLGGCSSFAPYQIINEIFFCGDLDKHPQAEEIRQFCKQRKKEPISLGDFHLLDVGTIFLI